MLDIIACLDERGQKVWQQFIESEQLSERQARQFADYLRLLIEWSKRMNLTTITAPSAAVKYHFQDSLQVGREIDFTKINTICDVGTGGGFPGIPLKIKYTHLKVILVEVSHKKVTFLNEVIQKLQLEGMTISEHDWRTFLRKTTHDIDLFCARASLQPEELIRMFKPSCPYKHAQLVYWASKQWESDKKEQPYIAREVQYAVGNKKRKLVFLRLPEEM